MELSTVTVRVDAGIGTANYAWAILPNHCHLLLRSCPIDLPVFMRRWLTGYAITFNRRHQRVGHLFQNRYKSIVCGEDANFRELVRCIRLNSLRAGLVASLRALDRYLWCSRAGGQRSGQNAPRRSFGPPVRVPGITPDELAAGSRRGPIPVLRAIIAKELITRPGLSLAEAARRLGVTTSAVSPAVRRPGPE